MIRLENIGHLRFIAEKKTFISPEKYESLMKHTVRAGDIIFASFIDDEIRACVLPALPNEAIAKADCFCLRPRADSVDRDYLVLQLVSQHSYDALIKSVHGATRPRINTTQLRNLEVRMCSLAEQQEIVRRAAALFAFIDGIEDGYKRAHLQLDKLPQSILAEASRGELVPTEAELAEAEGREYESGERLLERIREQHAAEPLSKNNSFPRRKASRTLAART